jgi:hypothetical protein
MTRTSSRKMRKVELRGGKDEEAIGEASDTVFPPAFHVNINSP